MYLIFYRYEKNSNNWITMNEVYDDYAEAKTTYNRYTESHMEGFDWKIVYIPNFQVLDENTETPIIPIIATDEPTERILTL